MLPVLICQQGLVLKLCVTSVLPLRLPAELGSLSRATQAVLRVPGALQPCGVLGTFTWYVLKEGV